MSQSSLISRNPYTKEILREYSQTSPQEIEAKLEIAQVAFKTNRKLSAQQRSELFIKVADLLRDRKNELAELAVQEMGKTITAARAEVEKCELASRYFAEQSDKIVRDIEVKASPRQMLKVLPLGCILAVMPWNFPYWQVFRATLAALSTGNALILKHASNVSGCAIAIESLFTAAGWPKGTMQTLLISSDRVKDLVAHSGVHAVTLTGSENAGRSVAKLAGENLKKSVLELGGSDAFVVSAQADIQKAAVTAAKSRTINNGQSCIAAKRFIVEKSVSQKFLSVFLKTLSELKVGDPMSEATDIGPLVTDKAFEDLQKQFQRCAEQGGEVLLEPHLDQSRSLFSPAVVKVPKSKINQGVFAEELFGPVALYFEAENLEEAFTIANNSQFGLGSSFWSQSEDEIKKALTGIEAGMTFINTMVASEPQLPFGGIKNSGYGRELGTLGPHEFANLKSISFALDSTTKNTE